jgi:hypothetical protein
VVASAVMILWQSAEQPKAAPACGGNRCPFSVQFSAVQNSPKD